MEETFTTPDNRQYTLWNSIDYVVQEVLIPAYFSKTKEERRKRGWIFRGQSDARWELLPTLVRKPCSQSIIDERQRYTLSFISALREHASSLDIPDLDNSKMLAISQHYGFPSSFMDFTYNIEIAAFFATATNPRNAEVGVIYCFNLKEYEEMRNPFSALGMSQNETDEILQDKGMQTLPPSVVVRADEIPRIKTEEAAFLSMSEAHSKTVMHECIDRFYFRQKPGYVYRGEAETQTWLLPSRNMFDCDESYESFVEMAKRDKPELFQKTPFIFDLLHLSEDRIAQFASDWTRSHQKSPNVIISSLGDTRSTLSTLQNSHYDTHTGRSSHLNDDAQDQSQSSFKQMVEVFYDGPYRDTPYQSQYIGKGRRLITKLSGYNELSVKENQRWLLWELFQNIMGERGYKSTLRLGKRGDSPNKAVFYFTIFDRWLEETYSMNLTGEEVEKGLWRGKFSSLGRTVLEASDLEQSDLRFSEHSNYRSLSDKNPYYGDNLNSLLKLIDAELENFNSAEQDSFLYDLQKILMKNFGRSLEAVAGLGTQDRCHLTSPLVRPNHSKGDKQLIFEVYDGFFQSLKYTSVCSLHWDHWCEADSNPMNNEAEIFLGLQ